MDFYCCIMVNLSTLVEHAAVNRRVVGSSPTGGARKTSFVLTDKRGFLCVTAALDAAMFQTDAQCSYLAIDIFRDLC